MKNWTIKEAVATIQAGTDLDGIKEITSHFPVFALAAAKNDLAGVAVLMSDKFTLNRLAKEPTADEDGEDNGAEQEVPKTTGKSNKTEAAGAGEEKSLEEMTTKELMKLCDKRGIKVPHYGKNKQFYLEQLQGAGAGEDTDVEDDGAEETEADPYEGKTAKELHAMCKERGIKADIKKPAKSYAELLRKADAEAEEAGDDGDGDDWGEEEAEEAPAEKPARSGKSGDGGKTKPAAKAAKEDDGDEWDI